MTAWSRGRARGLLLVLAHSRCVVWRGRGRRDVHSRRGHTWRLLIITAEQRDDHGVILDAATLHGTTSRYNGGCLDAYMLAHTRPMDKEAGRPFFNVLRMCAKKRAMSDFATEPGKKKGDCIITVEDT